MKYAITASEDSFDASLDEHFGRCQWLLIYDSATGGKEFLPNPYRSDEEGVGPKLLDLADSKGVKKIISGSFGIRIKPLMDSKKIQMIIPGDRSVTVGKLLEMLDRQ